MPIIEIAPDEAPRLLPLLRQVHDLHVAAQPERYRPLPGDAALGPWLRDWLSAPGMHALAFENAGNLAGYLIHEVQRRAETPLQPAESRAMLHQISVDAAHRRQGIGRALILAMRARLPLDEVPVIATSWGVFNDASAALMRSVGFVDKLVFAEWRDPGLLDKPS